MSKLRGSVLFLILERSVLRLIFPRTVRGERSCVTFCCDLFAELEDRHADGDDEAEERELKSVPRFESENSDGERDKSHGLQ